MKMRKLVIQIPCFNEAESLPIILSELPREVNGFDKVEFLIIDDGSTDSTVKVARSLGVHHIISFTKNQGLARAFMAGLETSLMLGADVIVNTDADNQYKSEFIPALVSPIVNGKAEIVIGVRQISNIEHFSYIKKILQKIGSWVVRYVSQTNIEDAPSGFRAISREAALKLNVYNNYTYTLETIIAAGQKNIKIISIPIETNSELRPSRLVKSIPSYVRKSLITIVRIFIVYRPFRFFSTFSLIFILIGFVIGLRFLILEYLFNESGHIQSLILVSIFLFIGFMMLMLGFVGDLLSVNRKLLEDIQYTIRKNETRKQSTDK